MIVGRIHTKRTHMIVDKKYACTVFIYDDLVCKKYACTVCIRQTHPCRRFDMRLHHEDSTCAYGGHMCTLRILSPCGDK